MNGFVNDALWGKPALSYNVVAMATPALQRDTVPILQHLSDASDRGALHLTPPEALHVSLYTVAPVRDRFDKHHYWRAVEPQVRDIVAQWSRGQAPLTLAFRQLRVLPAAIVAVAESDDAVWSLRRQIAAALTPPPTGAPRYDMIHMTLARYADAARLPTDFATRIATPDAPFAFRIDTVELIREFVYPSLVYDRLTAYSLSGHTA